MRIVLFSLFFVLSQTLPAHADNLSNATVLTEVNELIENKSFASAEDKLRSLLKTNNNKVDLLFLLGRILSWQKKYDEALEIFNQLLTKQPENSDYLLARSQTLHWSGKLNLALTSVRQARTVSPGYAEAWQLELRILKQKSDQAGYKKTYQSAKQQFGNPDWLSSLAPELAFKPRLVPLPFELEAGTSYDQLSGTYDSWSSIYIDALHRYSDSTRFFALLEQFKRFDLTDNELTAGSSFSLAPQWTMTLTASNSNTHFVRPMWMLDVDVQHAFKNKLNLAVGVRHSEYDLTQTDLLRIKLEQYWQVYSFAYTINRTALSATTISDESNLSHVFSSHYYYDNNNSIGLSLTDGKELEFDGTASPPLSDIQALVINGRHWYERNWAVTYYITYHKQGEIYTRNGVRVGLRHRF